MGRKWIDFSPRTCSDIDYHRPNGFLNAANQLRMHPSDSRMSSWSPATYTVGTSKVTSFPMALFKSVNSPLTIKFTASSSQTGAATLRIGTTLSFASGRPQVVVCSSPVLYITPPTMHLTLCIGQQLFRLHTGRPD
jgi:hypothetical protein